MKTNRFIFLFLFFCVIVNGQMNKQNALSFKMEELTSLQFVKAVQAAGSVAIIPMGIIEKHGPALPLGTDLFEAREVALNAAKQEYAVVFPPYYSGQIFEARHQPGTVAYSSDLMWKMLEETCKELARNGLKKIILLNGHGGNNSFLQYFCQAQLAGQKDYIVVLFQPGKDPVNEKEINSLKKAKLDGHAGEEETSMIYFINPSYVDLEALNKETGFDQARLSKMPFSYTGIWWYAKFPNHFASDFNQPDKRLGELIIKSEAGQLAELIKYLKQNNTIEELQNEFYKKAQNPLQK
jgi:creatinine amidohydrolase